MEKSTKGRLNRNQLKLIAIICMVIDHIAYCLVDYHTPLFHVMRFFGRCTAPLMCFFLAEGWIHTSNKGRYILRMFIFGLISYVPYILMDNPWLIYNPSGIWQLNFDMQLTLTLCLVMLAGWDWLGTQIKENQTLILVRSLWVLIICLLCKYCDWLCFAPLWVLNSYLNRNNFKRWCLWFIIIGIAAVGEGCYDWYTEFGQWGKSVLYSIYTFGFLLAIPLIKQYDGTAGRKGSKYFFYAFYPIHIWILVAIQLLRG